MAAALTEYWNKAYQALPVERIRMDLDTQRHRDTIDAGWVKLRAAIATGASQNFKWRSGKAMHRMLFEGDGLFAQLRAASEKMCTKCERRMDERRKGGGKPEKPCEECSKARAEQLDRWLEEHGDSDLGVVIDEAMCAADNRGNPVESNKRKSYLADLSDIVESAHELQRLTTIYPDDVDGWRIKLAASFAKVLRKEWDQLGELDVTDAERPVVLRILDDLNFIKSWEPKK